MRLLGRRSTRHQISFTCSNGSRHDVQRYIALHAVGPNSEVSSTSCRPAPRAGQRPTRRQQREADRTAGRRSRAVRCRVPPAPRDPRAVIQSLDHAGRQADPDLGVEAGVGEPVHQVVAHRGHRRAAGVGRRDRHDARGRRPRDDRAEHPEVLEREHRHLRVGDRSGDGRAARRVRSWSSRARPRSGHHSPLGWARATDCISASRCESASVCRPSRPMPPADRADLGARAGARRR